MAVTVLLGQQRRVGMRKAELTLPSQQLLLSGVRTSVIAGVVGSFVEFGADRGYTGVLISP